MTGQRTLLFPIEIMNREVDFRLFLACLCAKPGNKVLIGQHDSIFRATRNLERAVYVGKNIFNKSKFPNTDLTRYRTLKRNRSVLVHLHEEGAFFFGGRDDWGPVLRWRLDPTFLAADDHVCTWGRFQQDYYRSLDPACESNISATGHPRFDLLKPEYRAFYDDRVDDLRSAYGEFVLINTNFAYANNALGVEDLFSERFGYFVSDPDRRTRYLNTWAHHVNVLAQFVQLVDVLSQALPQRTIIVRPHPAEDHGFYHSIFTGVPNVKVVHEGSVAPWLLACGVLIHNGCTTGAEAHFAGTPTINFNPSPDPASQVELPALVGTQCGSVEETVATTRQALAMGRAPDDNRAFIDAASDILLNLHADGFERVASVIEQADRQLGGEPTHEHSVAYRLQELRHQATDAAKKVVRPLFPQKAAMYAFWTGERMFYGFERDQIAPKFERIQQMLGIRIRWELVSRDVISVELAGGRT